jgi:hypothetical protein
MKLLCSCGYTLTRENSKYIGIMEGESGSYDLELYDCLNCNSCRTYRIYREDGIVEIENRLERLGFFEEAGSVGKMLRFERAYSYVAKAGR